MPFYTPKQKGLTPDEIEVICERLWKEAQEEADTCPDCGVKGGSKHQYGCDIARCVNCGGQAIYCDCNKPEEDIWSGIYPGYKECYEKKLICYHDFDMYENHWSFDLNTLATLR